MLSGKPRTRSVKKLVQGHTESKDLNLGLIRIGLQNLGGGEGGFFLPYKIINERITSNITADKGPYSQSYSFSSSLVWRCESQTIKKAEYSKIDASNYGVGEDS